MSSFARAVVTKSIERFGHVSWAILDQALVSGSNFVSGILLARILGPDEFGRYVLAWTALLLIQALQHAGITSAMLSIGPREDGDRSSLYYGSMVVQHIVFLTGATAVAALCLLALAAVRPGWRVEDLILPMTMALTVCLAHDFLRRYFYSSKRPWMSVAIDVSRHGTLVAILVAYLLARWPATSATALWIMAATSLVAVALDRIAVLGTIIRRIHARARPGSSSI